MRAPTLILILFTALSFLLAFTNGRGAQEAADRATSFGTVNAAAVQDAASRAASSNIWLTLAGVGVIGLLMLWSLKPRRP